MFDSNLRNVKDQLATPIAMRLGRVSPMTVTLVGFVVGLGSAFLAARGAYLWAVVFWGANRALDGLDGLLARLQDRQTRKLEFRVRRRTDRDGPPGHGCDSSERSESSVGRQEPDVQGQRRRQRAS